jgi:DNA-binding response OmpR family regulator
MKRILCVEDERVICDLCQKVLGDEGYEVDVAQNGNIAQQMIGLSLYDIFLIDIRLPVMDGKELFRWMQKAHPLIVSRVIFTTGDTISKDALDFLEQVRRPFLAKPFTIDQLIDLVHEVLGELDTDNIALG